MKATAHRRIGRRFVACLAAIAMALAGSIVVAATVAPTASAASAWESLSLTEKQSSYGFFMWRAENGTSDFMRNTAKDAANILKNSKLPETKNIGGDGDATSLPNLKMGAEYLVRYNKWRSEHSGTEPCRHDMDSKASNGTYVANCPSTAKLGEIRTSDTYVALTENNTNYGATAGDHAANHGQAYNSDTNDIYPFENLAWAGESWQDGEQPTDKYASSTDTTMGIKGWYSEKSDFDAQSKTAVLGHYLTMTDKRENSSTYTFSYSPHTVGAYAVNYSTPKQAVIGQRYSWDSKGNETVTNIMGWSRTKTEGMDLDLVYNGKSTYARYTESATDYLNDVNAYISLVKTIGSVTAPAGITVESGTDPKASAPSTVSVTYSDGTTGTANVTWDDSNTTWKNRKGGSYTMSGTVHDSVANKDLSTSIAVTVKPAGIKVANTSSSTNLTVDPGTDLSTVLPTLTSITYTNGEIVPGGTLKWSIPDGATNGQHLKSTDFSVPGEVYDADGVDTKQTVNANITVRPITVSTVNAVTASTTSGIAPSLPSTVTVNWSYGDPSTESVTWDSIPASSYAKAGTFTVNGIVNLGSGTTTKATATVTVQDAIPASVVFDGTSSPSTSLTIDAGTDPTSLLKAKTATVTYTDSTGATIRTDTGKAVTWDAVKRSDYMGSTTADTQFTVKGTVDGLPVTAIVTVRQATLQSVSFKTDSVVTSTSVTTKAGVKPSPSTSAVESYSNGKKELVELTWPDPDASQYHGSPDGDTSFTMTTSHKGFQLTADVTVQQATLTSVTFPGTDSTETTVSTDAGTAPALPANAELTYSNGDTRDAAIAWNATDPSKYHGSIDADTSYTLTGTASGQTLTATVTVRRATPSSAVIKGSDSAQAAVTTAAGTAPALPGTATVTYSNGDTRDTQITWDAIPESSYHGSIDGNTTFQANGTVDGTSLTVSAAVMVTPPTATKVAFDDGTAESAVSTPAGIRPGLPGTATVTYSNGDTRAADITWGDVTASQYAKAGAEFDVTGHVTALPGTALTAHVTVTDAYLVSVTFHGTDSTTTTVTTPAGTRPALPETADATYSDGTVVPVTIQWDATPDSSYHGSADADQTVSVTGHASGTDLTATVTVQRATPTSAVIDGTTSAIAVVSTDAGVAPSLPATATVTYSNGDTANAAIEWDDIDASAYAGVIGQTTTFTVNGTADGMPVSATVTVAAKPATQNMYRLYNPNSGEHFFTGDMNEYKTLCDRGWQGEDVSWVAPAQGDAVYRLYNPNTGEHHYTLDTNERDTLIGQYGWKDEGIGWYSGGSTPVYRVYNPNAFQFGHLFTADGNERAQLLGYGWNDENIGWYAVSAK
ncbi:Bacterial Ig-like domain (group 4) protein [Pseudoscardovia radai]|uniref:Bacterial Ig-like domain (Group 4) protein n=1 Tax=Pseudoscardovia radai TaxID=987066 RepID=A0A261EZ76_9BIFI|nr:Ig-like domain-containing protein [Pseudoscardovia radai]OZG52170.1 Bacterial Ig-like domain (group 4) protein [Pseudoscardovia radai]